MIKSRIMYVSKWIFYTFLVFRIVLFLIQFIYKLTIMNFVILISLFIIINKHWKPIAFPLILFLILINIFVYQLKKDTTLYYLNSPNNKNTLIVLESAEFRYGHCDYYKKKYLLFKKNLNITTYSNEGYRPFACKTFTLTWVDDTEAVLNITENMEYKDIHIKLNE